MQSAASRSHHPGKLLLDKIADNGFQIPVFDADFSKSLGKNGSSLGRCKLLVHNDQSFSLQDAEAPFKITLLITKSNPAVRRKRFKLSKDLFLSHDNLP